MNKINIAPEGAVIKKAFIFLLKENKQQNKRNTL